MPSERTYNALNFTVGGCLAGYAALSAVRNTVLSANGAVSSGDPVGGFVTALVFAGGLLLMGYSLAGDG